MESTGKNYINGKIYTLRSPQTNKYYIGSTTQPLHKRLYGHRKDYEQFLKNKKNNITSFYIVKFEDCYIELLEQFPCENNEQLRKREGELIRQHKDNVVNKRIETRTQKEYYNDNKDKIIDLSKQHYKDNQEAKLNYAKEYHLHNRETILQKHKENVLCECGSKLQHSDLARHLKTEKHNERMKSKLQGIEIKPKLKSDRILCECGAEISRACKAKHIKTDSHQYFLHKYIN